MKSWLRERESHKEACEELAKRERESHKEAGEELAKRERVSQGSL